MGSQARALEQNAERRTMGGVPISANGRPAIHRVKHESIL
jgi:hypothetical protein